MTRPEWDLKLQKLRSHLLYNSDTPCSTYSHLKESSVKSTEVAIAC